MYGHFHYMLHPPVGRFARRSLFPGMGCRSSQRKAFSGTFNPSYSWGFLVEAARLEALMPKRGCQSCQWSGLLMGLSKGFKLNPNPAIWLNPDPATWLNANPATWLNPNHVRWLDPNSATHYLALTQCCGWPGAGRIYGADARACGAGAPAAARVGAASGQLRSGFGAASQAAAAARAAAARWNVSTPRAGATTCSAASCVREG